MGSRRSKHHKGRKPFYKEHRRNLCPSFGTSVAQTESLPPSTILASLPSARPLGGETPPNAPLANTHSNGSSARETMPDGEDARRADLPGNGHPQNSPNLSADTLTENWLTTWPDGSEPTSWSSAAWPDDSDLYEGSMTQQPLRSIEGAGRREKNS